MAIAVYLLFAGDTWYYRVFSMAGVVAGALVSVGVLVGFARPGAMESAEDRQRLVHEAHTDGLTGLRNTRAFNEDLAREIARADRSGLPLGLVLLDVDGLKAINDSKGHQAGDELIAAVSAAMVATLRSGDMAYRIGGDEFAVVLPRESTWGAFRYAQRLQAALASSSSPLRPKASAGVAGWDGQTRDQLLHEADLALIAAKRGRRGALIYTDDLAVRENEYTSEARIDRLELVVTALAQAVDQRDTDGASHTGAVAEIAVLVARELGLDSGRVARIRRAALLHDVGTLAIDDRILAKPDGLTTDEQREIERHPAMGERIVAGLGLTDEARWVRHHHERVDGGGYPDGLSNETIPLESSILLVADAYEAMTTDRVYRAARSSSEALAEIERHAGTQFRADVVGALTVVLASGGETGESNTSGTQNTQKAHI